MCLKKLLPLFWSNLRVFCAQQMALILMGLIVLFLFVMFISVYFILKLSSEVRASNEVVRGLEQDVFRLGALLRFLEAQEIQSTNPPPPPLVFESPCLFVFFIRDYGS